jgi:hypothetical protein
VIGVRPKDLGPFYLVTASLVFFCAICREEYFRFLHIFVLSGFIHGVGGNLSQIALIPII